MRHYVDPAGIPCQQDAVDLSAEVTMQVEAVTCPQCVNALISRKLAAPGGGMAGGPARTMLPPDIVPAAKPWPITPETVRAVFGINFPPEREKRVAELLMQLQEACSR